MLTVNCTNAKLCLLDGLGHRYNGRVYRAMSRNGNLCDLQCFAEPRCRLNEKKANVHELSTDVVWTQVSLNDWNMAYSNNGLPKAFHGNWGGGDAIITPDLEIVTATIECTKVHEVLKASVEEKLYDAG